MRLCPILNRRYARVETRHTKLADEKTNERRVDTRKFRELEISEKNNSLV